MLPLSATLDQLPTSSQVGKTRVGGIDVSKPRMRAVLSAALSLACSPDGFTAGQLADRVRSTSGMADSEYHPRRAAYDIKKLRGKDLVNRLANSRRYCVPQQAVRTMAALVIIREKLLRPILAGIQSNRPTLPAPTPRHVYPHGGPEDCRLKSTKFCRCQFCKRLTSTPEASPRGKRQVKKRILEEIEASERLLVLSFPGSETSVEQLGRHS
jgi:hypothetical protein